MLSPILWNIIYAVIDPLSIIFPKRMGLQCKFVLHKVLCYTSLLFKVLGLWKKQYNFLLEQ